MGSTCEVSEEIGSSRLVRETREEEADNMLERPVRRLPAVLAVKILGRLASSERGMGGISSSDSAIETTWGS